MKMEITKIEVKQTAQLLAMVASIVVSFLSVLSLILLAFGIEVNIAFNYIISISVTSLGGKVLLLLAYPVLTYIMTYLTIAVLCLIYNITAHYTGGINVHSGNTRDSV